VFIEICFILYSVYVYIYTWIFVWHASLRVYVCVCVCVYVCVRNSDIALLYEYVLIDYQYKIDAVERTYRLRTDTNDKKVIEYNAEEYAYQYRAIGYAY